jgi:para-nitrobenzyl esterase
MVTHSGGGKVPRELSDRMASALAAFMRTGDPNTSGLPAWPRYTAERGEVMVLDIESEVRDDPDREARKAL